jgi:hypothetical protein
MLGLLGLLVLGLIVSLSIIATQIPDDKGRMPAGVSYGKAPTNKIVSR